MVIKHQSRCGRRQLLFYTIPNMKPFPVFQVLLIILIFKRSIVSAQIWSYAPRPCSGIANGIVSDPTDCRKYYVCSDSKATQNTCPPEFVFQPNVSFCEERFQFQSLTIQDSSRSDSVSKLSLRPSVEQLSCPCFSCPASSVYRPSVSLCVPRTQYRCPNIETIPSTTARPDTTSLSNPSTEQPSTPPECPETPWETFFCRNHISAFIGNPFNCTQYINCESSPPRNQECAPNRVFNLRLQDCIPGNTRTCAIDSVEPNFCNDRPNGNYPHPFECNRFVTCFRGELRVETCPRFYLFDSVAQRCTKGDVIQCSSLVR
ncbi:uncharacterized protein LOC131690626 [Topomyia yanbarensis]|uniref:uncharacterized protein LOC131690626 n=1 Tax=Topomyia yanbarensis TaxID=2498891 RepID=UPI00273BFF60|nr:uncharacterized protein LOC131690626 [Topomyia yanbarensis]